MMDMTIAMDIARRFVEQDAESKKYINEEDDAVDGNGTMFLQLQNWSDDDGDRTYVDLVSYPGDSVSISKRVEPMDDVNGIAKAIMEVCEEVCV